MKRASLLLAELRSAGVSVRAEHGQLIVDAPLGVATAEIRAELTQRKQQLIRALEVENDDKFAATAFKQIAALLVAAYERYTNVRRVSVFDPDPVNKELALSRDESVHGHGQPL